MCPKCQGLSVSDISTMDDKQSVLFCGMCGFQANEIEFLVSDEPIEDEPRPSLWQRLINRLRS